MSFAEFHDTVQEGDTVVIYENIQTSTSVVVTKGKTFNTRHGRFDHDKMIGHKFGTKLYSHSKKGYVTVLHPTAELWTSTLPHRTQILYAADIATIIAHLRITPGSVVCESGTGSGSLSHALIRAVMPHGHLHTFEFHQARADKAREEFIAHGLGAYVTVKHADACAEGFNLENVADAVFLDLPSPWLALPTAKRALKVAGGRLCSFSPCMEQVQRTCAALADMGFIGIKTVECLERTFEVKSTFLPDPVFSSKRKARGSEGGNDDTQSSGTTKLTARPFSEMRGHTGFLTFASLPPTFTPTAVVLTAFTTAPTPAAATTSATVATTPLDNATSA